MDIGVALESKPHYCQRWIQDFPDPGTNLLFNQKFPKNCMKIKKIGPGAHREPQMIATHR